MENSGVRYVKRSAVRNGFLILFVISMSASALVLWHSQDNDARIENNTRNVCLASNRSAASVNEVLDAIAAGVESGSYTPAQRAIRAKRYQLARVALISCP